MRTVSTIFAAIALSVAFVSTASADNGTVHRVSLADAQRSPTVMTYLRPGDSITYSNQYSTRGYTCTYNGKHEPLNVTASFPTADTYGTYFSEVEAYGPRGGALSTQRWSLNGRYQYWLSSTGRVTFDGNTFHNASRRPALVAGWCDR